MNAIPEWQKKFQKPLPLDNSEPWDKRFKKPSFQDIFKKLEQESADFNQAKAGFLGAAVRFAKDTMNDDIVRTSYQRNVERVLAEVEQMIKGNKITHEEGARFCHNMRNELMEMHRQYTSKFGLAIAKGHKKVGKPFEDFLHKYSYELFNKDYNLLSEAEAKEVLKKIMKKSAEPNLSYTRFVKRLQVLGRVTLVASGILAAYEIVTADNKLKEAMKQGIGIAGGIAGGAAAGASVSLICGPIVAPECALVTVSIGAIVGGIYGYYTANLLDDELEELTKWINL